MTENDSDIWNGLDEEVLPNSGSNYTSIPPNSSINHHNQINSLYAQQSMINQRNPEDNFMYNQPYIQSNHAQNIQSQTNSIHHQNGIYQTVGNMNDQSMLDPINQVQTGSVETMDIEKEENEGEEQKDQSESCLQEDLSEIRELLHNVYSTLIVSSSSGTLHAFYTINIEKERHRLQSLISHMRSILHQYRFCLLHSSTQTQIQTPQSPRTPVNHLIPTSILPTVQRTPSYGVQPGAITLTPSPSLQRYTNLLKDHYVLRKQLDSLRSTISSCLMKLKSTQAINSIRPPSNQQGLSSQINSSLTSLISNSLKNEVTIELNNKDNENESQSESENKSEYVNESESESEIEKEKEKEKESKKNKIFDKLKKEEEKEQNQHVLLRLHSLARQLGLGQETDEHLSQQQQNLQSTSSTSKSEQLFQNESHPHLPFGGIHWYMYSDFLSLDVYLSRPPPPPPLPPPTPISISVPPSPSSSSSTSTSNVSVPSSPSNPTITNSASTTIPSFQESVIHSVQLSSTSIESVEPIILREASDQLEASLKKGDFKKFSFQVKSIFSLDNICTSYPHIPIRESLHFINNSLISISNLPQWKLLLKCQQQCEGLWLNYYLPPQEKEEKIQGMDEKITNKQKKTIKQQQQQKQQQMGDNDDDDGNDGDNNDDDDDRDNNNEDDLYDLSEKEGKERGMCILIEIERGGGIPYYNGIRSYLSSPSPSSSSSSPSTTTNTSSSLQDQLMTTTITTTNTTTTTKSNHQTQELGIEAGVGEVGIVVGDVKSYQNEEELIEKLIENNINPVLTFKPPLPVSQSVLRSLLSASTTSTSTSTSYTTPTSQSNNNNTSSSSTPHLSDSSVSPCCDFENSLDDQFSIWGEGEENETCSGVSLEKLLLSIIEQNKFHNSLKNGMNEMKECLTKKEISKEKNKRKRKRKEIKLKGEERYVLASSSKGGLLLKRLPCFCLSSFQNILHLLRQQAIFNRLFESCFENKSNGVIQTMIGVDELDQPQSQSYLEKETIVEKKQEKRKRKREVEILQDSFGTSSSLSNTDNDNKPISRRILRGKTKIEQESDQNRSEKRNGDSDNNNNNSGSNNNGQDIDDKNVNVNVNIDTDVDVDVDDGYESDNMVVTYEVMTTPPNQISVQYFHPFKSKFVTLLVKVGKNGRVDAIVHTTGPPNTKHKNNDNDNDNDNDNESKIENEFGVAQTFDVSQILKGNHSIPKTLKFVNTKLFPLS